MTAAHRPDVTGKATGSNGQAVAGFVTGLLSPISALFIPIVGIVLGVVGIVLGLRARKQPGSTGLATAGIVLGAVGIVLAIVLVVAAVAIVNS
ncbi:DUF4190 domain-containing protein [Modestobacter muralis]|uniref:DUF4190 domain-containing protein n=1 Tax=Modestobacter muralis TaxID=1608614 RepID=UPI001B8ADCD0|nr:DUF4190 domain-containing protein [Modestobacter muralis]